MNNFYLWNVVSMVMFGWRHVLLSLTDDGWHRTIFTELALLVDSVYKSKCPSVCMYVPCCILLFKRLFPHLQKSLVLFFGFLRGGKKEKGKWFQIMQFLSRKWSRWILPYQVTKLEGELVPLKDLQELPQFPGYPRSLFLHNIYDTSPSSQAIQEASHLRHLQDLQDLQSPTFTKLTRL